jgi:multidrug efflux pump subunit AcrA (membrane-fusion protein)
VKHGDVTFTVNAQGRLEGGNAETLAAPMTGGEMRITVLRTPGALVKAGDIVLQFDTTEQDFQLKEAEADLAEAEQQVLKAKAESQALEEENRYSLIKTRAEVRQAELEVRKNPLASTISARQNDLALAAARDRLAQIEHDLANRSASSQAAIEIQEAARKKAQTQAETARRNIEQMSVHARSDGYVSVRQNTNVNFYMEGMPLPLFRVGDRASSGMVVAEIPDLKHWQVSANVGELDRGHLAVGQVVEARVVALPFRTLTGRIKNIGGTTGPFWDRHFECSISIENPPPELRPGMNATVVITTEVLRNVLWLPSQAVFESDGRSHVYVRSGSGFAPKDVKVVRRSESRVVLTGLNEGETVTLASPDQQTTKAAGKPGALEALPR